MSSERASMETGQTTPSPGAGGPMVRAQSIIADVVSPRERGRYMGYFGGVLGLATVAGPLIGGFFVDHLSWRWVFYVNLPLGIAALLVTAAVLHLPVHHIQHGIDYLGAALLAAGVSCLVLVTTWGGTQYAWGSLQIIVLGVGGVVLLILLTEYGQMLGRNEAEQSPSFRRVVLELLRAERTALERLVEQDGISPAVAERAVRDLRVAEADVGK